MVARSPFVVVDRDGCVSIFQTIAETETLPEIQDVIDDEYKVFDADGHRWRYTVRTAPPAATVYTFGLEPEHAQEREVLEGAVYAALRSKGVPVSELAGSTLAEKLEIALRIAENGNINC